MKKTICNDLIKTTLSSRIVGVACGSGRSALQARQGGADLILSLNAGLFRNYGLPSTASMLPFRNSNRLVKEFTVNHLIPLIDDKPIIFGACATDPCNTIEDLVEDIYSTGVDGICNFPTVSLVDGVFREALEENGFGYDNEVEMIRIASQRGLFTIAFVLNSDEAIKMAKAGADIICVNFGWTGSNGLISVIPLNESIDLCNKIFDAASSVREDIIYMIYGGPVTSPEVAEEFYKKTRAKGYIGGSAFEVIPVENSIKEVTEKFKNYYRLEQENISLRKKIFPAPVFQDIISESMSIRNILEIVSRAADKDVNILIQGESGTGKELFAKAVHSLSHRKDQPFIQLNCAALNDNLIETELFGHEKGAFTGASSKRIGRFEMADKGTLFLDEIGELGLALQAKLLRVIQQKEFERVGSSKTITTDVRLVSATNVDLAQLVSQGRFREDLYYRLNVVSLNIPPLRDRKEDISLLINHFLTKFHTRNTTKKLSDEAYNIFMQYHWPGNIRQLENMLSRLTVLTEGVVITETDIKKYCPDIFETDELTALREKTDIINALDNNYWNRSKTAKELNISRKTLYNKMRKYSLNE